MLVIGLTGTKASGKGEVAGYLKAKGFQYYSLSDIVRQEAKARGLVDVKIKQLQDIGDELRKKHDLGILARMAANKILCEPYNNYLIDGIRNPGEIIELRNLVNAVIIAIDAPAEIRFKRLISRARPSDPKTWAEFLEMDKRDRGIDSSDKGQQVEKCMEMADYSMQNPYDTLEPLHKGIDFILKYVMA